MESTKNLLELVSSKRFQDTRSIYKNQLHFYTLMMNKSKNEIKKTIPYSGIKKDKMLRNKFNKSSAKFTH